MKILGLSATKGVFLACWVAILLPSCAGLRRGAAGDGGHGEAEAVADDGVERVSLDGDHGERVSIDEVHDERVSLDEDHDERVFMGNITLVNEKSRFVLIKTPVKRRLEKGIPLQSFNEGGMSAELLFSPEQTVGFMTADISEGAPMVGDQVYLRYTEDFKNAQSPRMQRALEQYQREQNMSFFERRKYNREKKRQAKAAKKRRDAAAR